MVETEKQFLVCAPNWLGDNIMAFPAISAFKRANKNCRIAVLVRESLADLWRMCSAVDCVKPFEKSLKGTLCAATWVRGR